MFLIKHKILLSKFVISKYLNLISFCIHSLLGGCPKCSFDVSIIRYDVFHGLFSFQFTFFVLKNRFTLGQALLLPKTIRTLFQSSRRCSIPLACKRLRSKIDHIHDRAWGLRSSGNGLKTSCSSRFRRMPGFYDDISLSAGYKNRTLEK